MIKLNPVKNAIETLFMIPNKSGTVVPFKLNNMQLDYHDKRTGRDDILKFRQGGMTSFIMAWFLIECMYGYTRAVMIAHDKEHTEKLLQRCHFYLSTMKGPKPKLKKANAQEILFEKTHSSFFIGTAGSKQFGRSDTITHLHCSEVAFWKNAKDLTKGLFQAVPHSTGIIVKECTANGMGTWHHRQYLKAMQKEGRFKAFFYPWYIFKEYQSDTSTNFTLTKDEEEIKAKFKTTNKQLQWRREKLGDDFDDDLDAFHQEYPATEEEAFVASGGGLFKDVVRTKTKNWNKITTSKGILHMLSPHPIKEANYVIGSDTSGGTGNDYSTMVGICIETAEQVLEYKSNVLSPPKFAPVLSEMGHLLNTAYLVVEKNQHGLSVLSMLKDMYPIYRLYKEYKSQRVAGITRPVISYGFQTTQVTKPFIIGLLQKYLMETYTLYGADTLLQLQEFIETEAGKLEGPEDDLVIALALSCVGMQKEQMRLAIQPKSKLIPNLPDNVITFEDIISRVKKKEKPVFKDQHSESIFDTFISEMNEMVG